MRSHTEIWTAVEKRCTPMRQDAIAPLRYFLATLNNPHAILLTGGRPASPLDDLSARSLEDAIGGHYANTPNFRKADAASWLNLISSAIKEFLNDGLAVSQTWVIPFAGPGPSLFNERAVLDATQVHLWRESLQRWIINDASTASRAEFQAGVLLSSLLHGMLVDSVKIKRLLRHLCRNHEPEVALDAAFISFKLPFEGLGEHHLQRWQLDRITEMLYWRAIQIGGADLESAKLYDTVKRILTRHGTQGHALPKQFAKLVKITATWWAARSSQTETVTASRAMHAHAFREVAWGRLTASADPLDPHYTRALPGSNYSEEDEPSSENLAQQEIRLLFPWFGEALSVLEQTQSTAEALESLSAANSIAEPEYAHPYTNWLKWQLQGKSSSGANLSLNIIRSRFSATVTQLLAVMGEVNPSQLQAPALIDYYTEAAYDLIPGGSISDLKVGLQDFEAFLAKTLRRPPLGREIGMLGNDANRKPVDGNIITFDDYVCIRKLLETRLAKRHVSKEEVEICQIVLMFAFKTGMRRMEIFGLRLSDFQDDPGLVLTVSPYADRGLKTSSSERVIPLRPFLNFEERVQLKRFIAARRDSVASSSEEKDFLFRQFASEKSESWINKIYTLIRNAIRKHTKDEALYMHHLRHSFASWTYLRLRSPAFPELAQSFSHLPQTQKYLERSRKLRLLLLYQDPDNTRRFGYAVARLLGHSSPLVSFNHYIHCCDLIAGSIAARETRSVEDQVLIAASGLPKSTAYENLAQDAQQLVRRVRQKHRQQATKATKATRGRGAPRKEDADIIAKHWIPFQTQLDALAILSKSEVSRETLIQVLEIEPEQLEQIENTMRTRGKRFAVTNKDGMIANPLRMPLDKKERVLFWELEAKLKRLFSCDRDLFGKGIEIHLSHVVLQKFDVKFSGKEEFQLLKRYLKFLRALDITASQLKWVFRQKDSSDLPVWCNLAVLPLIPTTGKRLAPPKQENAKAFADTVGVQMLTQHNDNGFGKHLLTLMLLASTVLATPYHQLQPATPD